MEAIRKIWVAIPLKLLWLVSLVSLTLGQFHPFSRFPMYSSFPPQSDFYYLAAADGKPLPTIPNLGLFAPELKQSIEHKYESYGEEWGNDTLLARAADEILRHLLREKERQDLVRGHLPLSLKRVILTRENGKLVKRPREVASWP